MKRIKGLIILAIILIALPILFPNNYFITVVGTAVALHAVLAISLNLLMGYAGQISLGHAAFFGIGAYSSAILTTQHQWNPLLSIGAGMLITGIIAFVIARPILKLKGHYLAMATLGFGIIVSIILVQAGNFTGGPDGLSDIPPLALFGWTISSDFHWYVVMSTVLLLIVWLVNNLIDSRSGRALRALHGSEVAAEMMGINTTSVKTNVFVLSALIASFVGSLFAHQQAFISPDSFSFFFSIELVTMVVLGGLASTYGAIFGALVLTFLPELLVVFEDYEVMVFGGILMLMMIFMPQGLFVALENLISRLYRNYFNPPLPVPASDGENHDVA
ncbi:MAG: branched-chain amino acid ABC transporter permease [Gammaproteobacteria bacterium]|nr:branched-chain amino acid ABC transporter permease [Gammaproteobacteria bacterium]